MSLVHQRPRNSTLNTRSGTGKMASDAPVRFGSSALRPKPYEKPAAQPSSANLNGKWAHDLFEPDSNLYGPKVRFNPKAHLTAPEPGKPKAQPSPSLRPFGSSVSSTAAPSSRLLATSGLLSSSTPISLAPTASQAPTVQPSPSTATGLSLLSRIQSGPSQKELFSNSAAVQNPLSPPLLDINNVSTPTSTLNPLKEGQNLKNENLRTQRAFDDAMAKYLSGPVILEVANLADGTSAEDVKTAFADFGEIQECTTEEGPKQGSQQTLKAKMVFINKAEAEKAVEALNGALADGLTLAVKIIGRPSKRPERADFMVSSPPANIPQQLASTDVVMKTSTEDVTMEDAQDPALPTIVPTGRLRSEVVAQCDPRASLQSEPQRIAIYQTRQEPPAPAMIKRVQVPSKPPRQQHFNRSSLPNRPAKTSAPRLQQNQSSNSKSLLARIGRA